MRRIGTALALAIMCQPVHPADVSAESSPDLRNSQIVIAYIEPTKSHLRSVYERMKNRQVLEQLQQFLSPLRLPVKLPIKMLQCNQTNAYYQGGGGPAGGVHICYEYIDWYERFVPLDQTPEGFTREDALVGNFVDTLLHELGHAVFDILQIPVFGREEDAADQIAGFIMLQFGKDVARRTLTGNAHAYRTMASRREPWPRTMYSDTHGHDWQRFYNYLCIAYGGDPETFKDFIEAGLLPKARADNCGREYQQVRRAFNETMGRYIDQDLLKQVQSRQWLRPEDGK